MNSNTRKPRKIVQSANCRGRKLQRTQIAEDAILTSREGLSELLHLNCCSPKNRIAKKTDNGKILRKTNEIF